MVVRKERYVIENEEIEDGYMERERVQQQQQDDGEEGSGRQERQG